METYDKKEVAQMTVNHDLSIDVALGLHKICSDIAYELGISDMNNIFDIVVKTLYLNTATFKQTEIK
jgi:hypothetical protein